MLQKISFAFNICHENRNFLFYFFLSSLNSYINSAISLSCMSGRWLAMDTGHPYTQNTHEISIHRVKQLISNIFSALILLLATIYLDIF